MNQELNDIKREIQAIKDVLNYQFDVKEALEKKIDPPPIINLDKEFRFYKMMAQDELMKQLLEKQNLLLRGNFSFHTAFPFPTAGKSLSEGIPHLEQHITESGGSIPSAQDHPPCERKRFTEFFLCQVPPSVLQYPSRIWGSISSDGDRLFYATESTVVKYVNIFLEDILKAMNLSFQLENHLGIKYITPNICVLTYGNRLVGVIEVKKPDKNILIQPTVLGELFDQLYLVEGFYSSGPVIGILTSLEEWIFAWFCVDDKYFTGENPFMESENNYFTPVKPSKLDNGSPVGLTLSQTSGWIHGLQNEDELQLDFADEFDLLDNFPRILSTTEVFNIFSDYHGVLQHICTSFFRMSQVRINFRSGIPQSVFKLYKDVRNISWHPLTEIPIDLTRLSSSRFPRSNTRALLALEDLGRGSSGKAWLTCTLSKKPAICVLKFSNKRDLGGKDYLDSEKAWWDFIYPEFSSMTKVEIWSGSYALMMPHFCSIPEDQRQKYHEDIRRLLIEKFQAKDVIHNDVKWRNIGIYLQENGESTVVLYDLQSVQKFSGKIHQNWIEEAIDNLYK